MALCMEEVMANEANTVMQVDRTGPTFYALLFNPQIRLN